MSMPIWSRNRFVSDNVISPSIISQRQERFLVGESSCDMPARPSFHPHESARQSPRRSGRRLPDPDEGRWNLRVLLPAHPPRPGRLWLRSVGLRPITILLLIQDFETDGSPIIGKNVDFGLILCPRFSSSAAGRPCLNPARVASIPDAADATKNHE